MPNIHDQRLAALKHHQKAIAAAPTEKDLAGKNTLMKTLLPLVLAQGVDMLTTESPTGFLAVPGTREANPLPGMQSRGGRLGWGALEAAFAALLLKKKPALGKAYVAGSTGVHSALARGNQDLTDRQRAKNAMAGYFRKAS